MRTFERKVRWKLRKLRWRCRRCLAAVRRFGARPIGPGAVAGSLAAAPLLALALLWTAGAAVPADSRAEPAAGELVPATTMGTEALERYHALRLESGRPWAKRYGVRPELAALIYEISTAQGIDPDLAFRLVRVESSFQGRAIGPRGAVGYAQVRPSTARWLDSTVTREKLFDAETNLRLGFRYLRMLLDRYDDDTRLVLLAYNRGPGTVAALLAMGEDPANGYASRVLGTPSSDSLTIPTPNEKEKVEE